MIQLGSINLVNSRQNLITDGAVFLFEMLPPLDAAKLGVQWMH